MSSNRISLAQAAEMPIGEIEQLPVEQIAFLLEDLDAEKDRVKRLDAAMHTALDRRFSEQAQSVRQRDGKDTGRVHIEEGECVVTCDLPKKVAWDQRGVMAAMATIRDKWEDDPANYVETKHTVKEAAFTNWPPVIRKLFEPARTVSTGKPTYVVAFADKAEAA